MNHTGQSAPTATIGDQIFAARHARSASLLGGLLLAVAVETIAVHLWLITNHPILAWTLSAVSVLSLLWLVGDYRALGRARVELAEQTLCIRVGWRATADIPLHVVQSVQRPAWRDIPESGQDKHYLDLMAPTDPNVLLTLHHAVPVRLMGSLNRPATRLGLTLDAPDAFVAAMTDRSASASEST